MPRVLELQGELAWKKSRRDGFTTGRLSFDRQTGALELRNPFNGMSIPKICPDISNVVTWGQYKSKRNCLQILYGDVPLHTSYHSLDPQAYGGDETSYGDIEEILIDDFLEALRSHFVLESTQVAAEDNHRQQ